MKKDIEYYMSLAYEIIIRPLSAEEGGGYFANYKDFPYIMGDGETPAEAIEDVKSAFKGAVLVMLEHGDFIKEPINDNEKIRVNVSLPKWLVNEIDKTTNNRSEFLAQSALVRLSGNETIKRL